MSAQMEKEMSTKKAVTKKRRQSVLVDTPMLEFNKQITPSNAPQKQSGCSAKQICKDQSKQNPIITKTDYLGKSTELKEMEFTSTPTSISISCPIQTSSSILVQEQLPASCPLRLPVTIPTSAISNEKSSSLESNLEIEPLDSGSQSYSPLNIYIPTSDKRSIGSLTGAETQVGIESNIHIDPKIQTNPQINLQTHMSNLPTELQTSSQESQFSSPTLFQPSNKIFRNPSNKILSQASNQILSQASTKMLSQAPNQILTQVSDQILTQATNQNLSQISTQTISQIQEEPINFQDINLLTDMPGITHNDIENLKRLGIMTIRGAQTALRRLEIGGMDAEKAETLRQACSRIAAEQGITAEDGFLTALKVSEQRKSIFRISTGSENLDTLLGGGIESSSVTEVFGEAGSGKTQLCHTLCVMAQLPSNAIRRRDSSRAGTRKRRRSQCNYFGGKVIFLDTENTFRPERLNSIADRFDLDRSQVLDNIIYARALNSLHQYTLLNNVVSRLHAEPGIFKLLIVDSVVALFRADYASGSSCGVTNRQQRLFRMMTRLKEVAEEYNIAVLVTNHVTTDMSNTGMLHMTGPQFNCNSLYKEEQYKPTGGNALAHAVTTRFCLKRLRTNDGLKVIRKAKVLGSPELEEAEAEYVIGPGGIQDALEPEEEKD